MESVTITACTTLQLAIAMGEIVNISTKITQTVKRISPNLSEMLGIATTTDFSTLKPALSMGATASTSTKSTQNVRQTNTHIT